MKKFKILLLLGVILIPFMSLAGGGWTVKKGGAYFKISHWWLVASKYYNNDGFSTSNPTTAFSNTSLYTEFGITDRLTGIVYFPFFSRISRDAHTSIGISGVGIEKSTVNSLGDTDIAIKYRINNPKSKYAFAGTLLLGIPLGNDSGGSNGDLQTGDGEFNQLIRLDLSRSFAFGKKIGVYANVYTGFNNRTNNFSDEFRGGGEFGISFFKSKLWLIARLDIVEPLKNGKKVDVNSNVAERGATIYANNTKYVSYTYEIAYYITKKIGVSASRGAVFSASSIYAAPTHSVGVFLDLQ